MIKVRGRTGIIATFFISVLLPFYLHAGGGSIYLPPPADLAGGPQWGPSPAQQYPTVPTYDSNVPQQKFYPPVDSPPQMAPMMPAPVAPVAPSYGSPQQSYPGPVGPSPSYGVGHPGFGNYGGPQPSFAPPVQPYPSVQPQPMSPPTATSGVMVNFFVQPGSLKENLRELLRRYGWRTPEGEWWKVKDDYEIKEGYLLTGKNVFEAVDKMLASFPLSARFHLLDSTVQIVESQ